MCTVHDPDYRQSWKDWESYVETLTEKISEVDDTIPELPPKDLVRPAASTIFGSVLIQARRCFGSTATSDSLLIQLHTKSVSPISVAMLLTFVGSLLCGLVRGCAL